MRYVVTTVWAILFTMIIGFIASALTNMDFNPMQSVIIGAIFGLFFNVIPYIMTKSAKAK